MNPAEQTDPHPPGRTEAVAKQLVERFSAWIEDVLASEEPPQGVAAEILAELDGEFDLQAATAVDGHCDLQGLWSGLTALTQEIKLQGRAFKELSDRAAPLRDLDTHTRELLDAHQNAIQEMRRMAEKRRDESELLETLLDTRERLTRGITVADDLLSRARGGPAAGRLARLFRRGNGRTDIPVAAAEALLKGSSMALEQLDESLQRMGVEEIACEGRRFDPHLMTAAEIGQTDDLAEGMVMEVFRAGYTRGEDVLRMAQVRVARSGRNTDGSAMRAQAKGSA